MALSRFTKAAVSSETRIQADFLITDLVLSCLSLFSSSALGAPPFLYLPGILFASYYLQKRIGSLHTNPLNLKGLVFSGRMTAKSRKWRMLHRIQTPASTLDLPTPVPTPSPCTDWLKPLIIQTKLGK